jgi:predicted methyltransferase
MHGPAGAQHRFDDAEKWAKVFDDPARDAWQKPAELVATLRIPPGATVADLGAGTGYLAAHLAGAVGPDGRVLALEVEPNLIEHLKTRFTDQPNVEARLIGFDGPKLPPASVDRVVLLDVYHHIEGRPAYFAALRPALKPGGQLIVVDFIEGELPVGPPPEHRIGAAQVSAELAEAGYREVGSVDLLPYQYVKLYEVAAAP